MSNWSDGDHPRGPDGKFIGNGGGLLRGSQRRVRRAVDRLNTPENREGARQLGTAALVAAGVRRVLR